MTSPLAASVETLRTHVPTSRHAEMLFDVLVELLGDQGVLWTANEGRLRKLFRRDPYDASLIVPWPVAELSVGGRIGWVSPTIDAQTGEVVPERERPPGEPSRLRGLGPAEVGVYDGAAHVSLVFGDDGGFREASLDDRFPSRLGELPAAVASRRAPPVELIASCIALFDPGVHGPGRIAMPVPMPGGPEAIWLVGLFAARRALFAGAVARDDRYIVADGVSGAALGTGPTLAAAMAQFEARVAATAPAPDQTMHTAWDDYDDDGHLIQRGEMPEADDDGSGEATEAGESWKPPRDPRTIDLSGGLIRMTAPTPDVPLPPISVATVSRVVLPLAASPTLAALIGTWERTLGARGATAHVLRQPNPAGFLQVGERLLWRVDPRTLVATLNDLDADAAELDAALQAASPGRAFVRYRSTTYRWGEVRGARPAGLERVGTSSGPNFDGVSLDGDVEALVVRRHVRVPRPT